MHPVSASDLSFANPDLSRSFGKNFLGPDVAVVPQDVEQRMRLAIQQEQQIISIGQTVQSLQGPLHRFRWLQLAPIDDRGHGLFQAFGQGSANI